MKASGNFFSVSVLLLLLTMLLSCLSWASETEKGITFAEVMLRTARENPLIAAAAWDVKEKDALWKQAKTLPNPVLSLELENFGGSLDTEETKHPELTVTVSQSLDVFGTKWKQGKMAGLSKEMAGLDEENGRLDVLQEVSWFFVCLLGAQAEEEQARDFFRQSREIHVLIKAQVEVGKISPLRLKRAEILLTEAEIELDKAVCQHMTARLRLASLWGGTDSGPAAGRLDRLYVLPDEAVLWERVKGNPDGKQRHLLNRLSRTAVTLEKSRLLPTPEISGGLRKLRGLPGHTFTAALSFQLPLLDWNRGNVRAAQFHLQKEDAQTLAYMRDLEVRFRTLYGQWQSAANETRSLKERVLTAAEVLFQAVMEGYKAGKFSFLEVLEARQALHHSRRAFTAAALNMHGKAIELARLAGTTLDRLLEPVQPF